MASTSDQWLLSGDCKQCRKNKYCSKPCKRNMVTSKVLYNMLLDKAIANAMVGKSR